MNILILGNSLFSVDVQWGFLQAGCNARVITAANAREMEQILTSADADLLITLGAPLELRHEVMTYLKDNRPAKLKHIHWDTDGISSTYYPSSSGDGIEMDIIYAANPDLVLTMCPEMRDLIREKKFPCEIMHYAYSPISHYPMPIVDQKKDDINLIGNSYSALYPRHPNHYRYKSLQILLKPLLENGYDVHLYGDRGYLPLIKQLFSMEQPQVSYHGYMPYPRTCAAYNSSFINIVTQNYNQTITKRTFEILGSGGFALSSDNSEIRKLFTPGHDLIVSSSPEQTLELVKYYEKNRDEWREIRKNAALSAQKHTYQQRAEYILSLLDTLTK